LTCSLPRRVCPVDVRRAAGCRALTARPVVWFGYVTSYSN
jgi:hypothetical protein